MKTKKSNFSLVLRACTANLTSHGGFQYPSEIGATVSAPDWIDNTECGNGLHGWLFGQGDHSVATICDDSKWMVLKVPTDSIVMLGGKCKFPVAEIMFIGEKKEAAGFIIKNEPQSKSVAVIGATLVVGDNASVTVGALDTATAGYGGTATAGDRGTATAGDRGTATAGDGGELRIRWHDGNRYRTAVGYVGEDGIEVNVAYRVEGQGKFVKAERARKNK